MTAIRPRQQTLRAIFAAPLAVGALSLVGLVAALVGDGVWDAVSWVALAVPVLLFAGFVWRRPTR